MSRPWGNIGLEVAYDRESRKTGPAAGVFGMGIRLFTAAPPEP